MKAKTKEVPQKIKRSKGGTVAHVVNYSIMLVIVVIMLYPFWHVVMYALSDSNRALTGGLFLWPRGFTLKPIKMALANKSFYTAFGNTVFRTVVGTAVNVVVTAMLAYPLAQKRFIGRNVIEMLVFITMLFNGGMIPTFLVVKELGLLDSRLALILPIAVNPFNLFVLRNFFIGIPESLEESARIDGASPVQVLFRIIMPISLPALAAITMLYAVGHWNYYFDALLYINTESRQVLQNYLRTLLSFFAMQDSSALSQESIKMASITLSILPMIILYPFIQRYYVSGIMVGSVKG